MGVFTRPDSERSPVFSLATSYRPSIDDTKPVPAPHGTLKHWDSFLHKQATQPSSSYVLSLYSDVQFVQDSNL